ncbi:hypothetical protein HAX54_009469, partial [Datura stramonium]|nr:hypothetical protein [Datura stramonium]
RCVFPQRIRYNEKWIAVAGSLASSSSSPVRNDYSKTFIGDNGGALGHGRRVRY